MTAPGQSAELDWQIEVAGNGTQARPIKEH
jgi:hypothetical protein